MIAYVFQAMNGLFFIDPPCIYIYNPTLNINCFPICMYPYKCRAPIIMPFSRTNYLKSGIIKCEHSTGCHNKKSVHATQTLT